MKGYHISGGNGSVVQIEGHRFADTVIGDTSEKEEAHEALKKLVALITNEVSHPLFGDMDEAELAEYVGAK